ncbi:TadE family type IV pilus minor pilin [Streptomyces sp. NPDC005795]|uniref:TadE family type IV pilus minor pilin n=1 Tax=Streptomyces sp. NPDC005795 TaxID=3154677 RepID=UPI0033F2A6B6
MRSSDGGAGVPTGSGGDAGRERHALEGTGGHVGREGHARGETAEPARQRGDQGAVTAEAAMVIPVLVIFVLALLWALMAASAQIRCVDAARAGARAAARSESEAQVRDAALSAAPRRARVEVERAGELWRVTVAAPSSGPGPLAVTLTAKAVAAAEDLMGAEDQVGAAP